MVLHFRAVIGPYYVLFFYSDCGYLPDKSLVVAVKHIDFLQKCFYVLALATLTILIRPSGLLSLFFDFFHN